VDEPSSSSSCSSSFCRRCLRGAFILLVIVPSFVQSALWHHSPAFAFHLSVPKRCLVWNVISLVCCWYVTNSGRLHLLSPSLFLVKSERSSGVGGKILQKKSEGWEVASPCSQTLPPPSYLVTAPAVATTTDHDFRSASTWPGTFVDHVPVSPLSIWSLIIRLRNPRNW
jgi:hypothetical protein